MQFPGFIYDRLARKAVRAQVNITDVVMLRLDFNLIDLSIPNQGNIVVRGDGGSYSIGLPTLDLSPFPLPTVPDSTLIGVTCELRNGDGSLYSYLEDPDLRALWNPNKVDVRDGLPTVRGWLSCSYAPGRTSSTRRLDFVATLYRVGSL